jgi:hypothetical protein
MSDVTYNDRQAAYAVVLVRSAEISLTERVATAIAAERERVFAATVEACATAVRASWCETDALEKIRALKLEDIER